MNKRKHPIKNNPMLYAILAILLIGLVVMIDNLLYGIVIIAIAVAAVVFTKHMSNSGQKPNAEKQEEPENDPAETVDYIGKYASKELLTEHELKFYQQLKPISDKLNLSIITKVRMADLVKPTANYYKERSEYMSYFGKIKSKHVDFALCDPETLAVKLLIELDDKSHESKHSIKRDDFVGMIYRDTGYKLVRIYNNIDLEKKICKALDSTEEDSAM